MISFTPIWAMVLRYIRVYRRDANLVLASFYWPILDVMLWGYLGTWLAQMQTTQLHNYEEIVLLGLLLWQIVGRGCNFMVFSFNEELLSNNVVNLFSLPLSIAEWICSTMLFFVIMMLATSLLCMVSIFILYNVPIWQMILNFIMFAPPLFISAIWIGFMCLQIVVSWGKRGMELAFIMCWMLLPFSGAFYPIEVLPTWGQKLSEFIPMSYVFQGMRGYLMHAQDPTSYLIKGYALSIVYAICAIILFVYCFNRSKHKGLARLAD